MKILVSNSVFFALIGLVLSPLAVVAHAPVSPTDSVHSYAPFDYEQWRRDHPRPAGKALAALNRGEPRTVRMIYFLPNDGSYRAAVVQKMKEEMLRIQTFYAEQMQAQGQGNRTFLIETDAQGQPRVHRVDGRYPNSHYLQHDTADDVLEEIDPIFDIEANVYLIVVGTRDLILSNGREVGGVGSRSEKMGGFALTDGDVRFDKAAHELGHVFGLDHDFRDDTYIMSYGSPDSDRARLSDCNAEFLAVHPYFNRNSSTSTVHSVQPASQLISPHLYSPGSASVPIRLKVGGSKGLHQAILTGRTREPHFAAGFQEVQGCRGFAGQQEAVAQFEYDGTVPSSPLSRLSDFVSHSLRINVVDTDGNVNYRDFGLAERSPYLVASLEGHADRVISVAFSSDGTLIASGSEDNTVGLWDVVSRKRIATLRGNGDRIESMAFSPDGTLIAIESWTWVDESSSVSSGETELWDVANREQVASFWNVGAMAFSPDGTLLAIEETLWDVATRKEVANFENEIEGWASSMSFSPDGTLLAIGTGSSTRGTGDTAIKYEGRTVELWGVASRQRIATLAGHGNRVISVAFSSDGRMLASGSDDVRLWDVATRQRIATLTDIEGWASSVSFSPDGTLLAIGTGKAVELWDIASRKRIATLGHGGGVYSVSFSPDGTLLASGSEDNTVGLWDVAKVAVAPPHSLTKVSGDGQQGPANTRLAKPFVISVLDQNSSPLAGVRVVFSTGGGALLSPTSYPDPCAVESSASSITIYTNANGQASVRLTLGSQVAYSVKATVEGLEPVTFTAIKSGQASPHSLTKVCGDSQEGLVGEQLAKPFVVSVSDEDGAAIAGVVVSFSVTAGGGTLSAATATTDANGRAATRLTLGSDAGPNTVSASVAGLASATFTATGQKSALAGLFDSFLGGGKLVALPDRTQLLQNAPNPFNSQTVVSYFLLEPGLVRLEVFALTGQRIAVLHQGPQRAGYHRLHWDGRDAAGRSVASGTYTCTG